MYCLSAVQPLRRLAKKQLQILYPNLYRSALQHYQQSSDTRQEAFSNFETVLGTASNPLIVQAHQGQGIICYLAFDPAVAPLMNWIGTIALWKGLLLRTLGDQSLLPATLPHILMDPGNQFCAVGYSKFYSLARLFQPGFFSSYYSVTSLSSDQFAFSIVLH